MRNRNVPLQAAAANQPATAGRANRSRVRKATGGALLVLLSVLFWYVFYQNLPGNPLNGAPPGGDSATMDRTVKIITILVSLGILATKWSTTRLLLQNINPGLVAFIVIIPMSTAWSISPNDTMLRSVTLGSIVLLCLAIPLAGWERRRLQQLTIPPVMYVLVASLVLGAMYPDRITEIGDDLSQKGAWHGITYTKNLFGMMASIGVILCANLWLSRASRPMWALTGAAIGFLCLLLSRSSTSLLATVLAVGFMVMVMRVPVIKDRFSGVVAIGIATALILFELWVQRVIPGISVILSAITSITGKDATFSARTIIWDIIKEHAQGAPWLGTGYGAYWIGPTPNSPSNVFMWRMFFYPTESHNGYLEILNDLGRLGLLCLAIFLVSYVRQALQLMRFDRAQSALYLALLYQQMVMNMTESEWFSRSSTFAVMLLACTCLSRSLAECRAREPQPQPVAKAAPRPPARSGRAARAR